MKKTLISILKTLLGFCMGAGMALCVLPRVMTQYIDAPIWLLELELFLHLLIVYALYLVSIMLHEAGHLVGGLLSGYSFVSYRVLSFALIRLEGKLRLKHYAVAGTAGQCLLKPPAWTEKGIPVRLYNLGGILVNAVCLVAALPGCFAVPINSFGGMLLCSFAFVNGVMLLMNGLPMQNNDGDNVLHLSKDTTAVRAFWSQMMANALMAEGKSMRELPEDLFALPEDADLSNPMIAASAASWAQMPMCRGEYEKADTAMKEVLEKTQDSLPPVVRVLLINDRVWFELMHENRKEVLDSFKTKEFLRYGKAMKRSPSMLRTAYSEALAEGNQAEAQKLRRTFQSVARSYPYAQDIAEEQHMMELADAHFCQNAGKNRLIP